MVPWLFAGLLALTQCSSDPSPKADGFVRDETVRITAPVNGEQVGPELTVTFEVGEAVEEVHLYADDVIASKVDASDGSTTLVLEEGGHALRLDGLSQDGTVLSQHEITVQVVIESDGEVDPWVAIVSPADGAEVFNPVMFTLHAAPEVDAIELFGDDWSIGMAQVSGDGATLTYSFSGTGYPRSIEARASIDGQVVAMDEITVTVQDDDPIPTTDMNAMIEKIRAEYPTDGSHGYYWPDDSDWYGTTQDIWYQGELVAEGDPQGRCYCVGLTWEVYMRAFQAIDAQTGGTGSLNGLSVDDLTDFRIDWFVRDLLGEGATEAFDNYGVGTRITSWNQTKAGDFVQFWRNSGSGHNVIFVDWERDGDDEIIGFRYWSTQSSTDGIDYNEEYFGSGTYDVDPNLFFVGRAAEPADWIPW